MRTGCERAGRDVYGCSRMVDSVLREDAGGSGRVWVGMRRGAGGALYRCRHVWCACAFATCFASLIVAVTPSFAIIV